MPNIKLDGREIPFMNGDTIIRAAHRAGIDVPHYCWHPGLSVAANCRMCLVEILPPPGQRAMRLDVLQWNGKEYVSTQKPKLQPACQIGCTDGMEVLSDSSPHVADARKTVQELLLLNHPVDCPICDQAGECRLQDYWLEHGRYKKRMHDDIVHKPKAVSFGPTIVYDAERCIVCTRCVRFVEEVAKDPVLEKRERGNLGEIFVAEGRQLDNNYTLMTEHVCPVGALTSKDFRFKARVWFLRSARTVCQGCATGCNAHLDFDPRNQRAYRHRPRDNEEINKYWMCDHGMLSYARAHEGRITEARVAGVATTVADALAEAKRRLTNPGTLAIVLSAEHASEDNFALVTLAKTYLGAGDFFLAGRAPGEADGVLMSADRNPNTAGAVQVASTTPPKPLADLVAGVSAGRYTHVLALGSEAALDGPAIAALSRAKGFVAISAHEGPIAKAAHVVLPACSWAEMDGTYVNAQDTPQRSQRAIHPQGDSRPGWEWVAVIAKELGFATPMRKLAELRRAMAAEPSASLPPKSIPAPPAE
ncbi:MAG: (2Fe-2S)-binding protein [Polyangiaceae bacterium]|nr:(2Fe-2S)-binding protein [Polyangiaceae bacterium]